MEEHFTETPEGKQQASKFVRTWLWIKFRTPKSEFFNVEAANDFRVGSEINSLISRGEIDKLHEYKPWLDYLEMAQSMSTNYSTEDAETLKEALKLLAKSFPEQTKGFILAKIL